MGLTVERALATPGEPTHLAVRITNDQAGPVSYVVRAIGLDDDWVQPPVATEAIPSGATEYVQLLVELPLGYPASRQVIAVVAEPVAGAGPVLRAQTELVVGDGDALTLRLDPPDVRGRGARRIDVRVGNKSDETVEIRLGTDVPASHLRIDFDHSAITLPPGATGRTVATLRARSRPMSGREVRLPFAVTARGPYTPARAEGSFTQAPLFSVNVLKVLAVVAVLGLWAGALIAGLQLVNDDDAEPVAGDPAAAAAAGEGEGAGGAGGGAGGPGGGDAAGAGADGAGGEEAAGAAEEAGVRVGGTVEASDPSGVTVRLEPISLVEEEAQAATLSDSSLRSARAGKQATPRPKQALPDARSTSTDESGAWAFAGVPNPGFYLVTFSKAGFGERSHVLQTTDSSDPVVLDVILEPGQGAIAGTVVGPDGPMGGVDISVSDGTVTYGTATPTSGDEIGEWAVEGLSTPGTYLVTATRSGWGTETGLVELGSGESGSINLTMSQGVAALTGTVSSPGGPLGNIAVSVTDGTITRMATTLTEGAVGTFSLPQLPIPGTYTFTASGDGWVTATQSIELTGNLDLPVSMLPTTGIIGGRVSGPDGPLAGVGVTVTDGQTTLKNSSVAAAPNVAEGSYEIAGVPPGTYNVSYTFAGLEPASIVVELSQGEVFTQDIVLTARTDPGVPDEGHISGFVVDNLTQDEIPGATVMILGGDFHGVLASTDQFGNFTLPDPNHPDARAPDGLPPGIYNLLATVDASANQGRGYVEATRRVTLPGDATVETTLPMVPWARVDGTIESNLPIRTEPLANWYVSALFPGCIDSAGTAVNECEAARSRTVPDGTGGIVPGAFRFDRTIPPGNYEFVAVADDHHRSAPTTLTLTAGEQAPTMNFEIDRLARLRVTVAQFGATADATAAGAAVTISGPDGPFVETTGEDPDVANAANVVEFRGLAVDGTYNIDVTKTGYRAGNADSVGVARNTTASVEVQLNEDSGGVVVGSAFYVRDDSTTDPAATGTSIGIDGATLRITGIYPESFTFTPAREVTRPPITLANGAISLTAADLPFGFQGRYEVTHPNFVGTGQVAINFLDFLPSTTNPNPPPLRVELQPLPGRLEGTISFNATTTGEASIEVIGKPTGAGTIRVIPGTPNAGDGITTFKLHDESLGQAGTNPRVKPGAYTLVVRGTSFGTQTIVNQIVLPNATKVVNATLLGVGSVRVSAVACPPRTTCPPGTVQPANAQFQLWRTDTSPPTLVETKPATGTSTTETFNNLDPALTYEVRASGPGLSPSVQTNEPAFTVVSGQTVDTTVTFSALGGITATVKGKPSATGTLSAIEGVTVRVVGTSSGASCTGATGCEVTTDGTGTASFGSLVGGDYTVSVRPDGASQFDGTVATVDGYVVGDSIDVTVSSTAPSPTANFELVAVPALLEGTVTDDSDDTAEAGVKVEILLSGKVLATTFTDAVGFYRFDPQIPRTVDVRFSKLDFATDTRLNVALVRNETTDLDVELATSLNSIVGVVTATYGSDPVAVGLGGATVTATRIGGAGGTFTATTASTGTVGAYTIANLPTGTYRVSVSKSGYTMTTNPSPQLGVSGGLQYEADLSMAVVLRTVVVTVTTVDPAGGANVGLPGAVVELVPASGSTGRDAGGGSTITGAGGTVSIPNVVPGSYIVRATRDNDANTAIERIGQAAGDVPFAPAPTQPPTPLTDVALAVDIAEGVLSGDVFVDGTLTAGLDVVAVGLAGTFTTTTAGGSYSFFLPPGQYDVTATSGSFTASLDNVEVDDDAITNHQDLSIVTKGELEVRVFRHPSCSAITGADVRVLDAAGAIETSGSTTSGAIEFTLDPGTYAVEVQYDSLDESQSNVVITAGGVTVVTFVLDSEPDPNPSASTTSTTLACPP